MVEPLEWQQIGRYAWLAVDGRLRYRAKMGEGFRWRGRLDNELLGDAKGFASFEDAKAYVEWGGVPNRMGYDRETGEVYDDLGTGTKAEPDELGLALGD